MEFEVNVYDFAIAVDFFGMGFYPILQSKDADAFVVERNAEELGIVTITGKLLGGKNDNHWTHTCFL
jgi:hypothetical protein